MSLCLRECIKNRKTNLTLSYTYLYITGIYSRSCDDKRTSKLYPDAAITAPPVAVMETMMKYITISVNK